MKLKKTELLIPGDGIDKLCRKLEKETNIVFECYKCEFDYNNSVGETNNISLTCLYVGTGNRQSPEDAANVFFKAHKAIPYIKNFMRRRKLQFVDLIYKFEGEPEPMRISVDISFTICKKQ